MIFRKKKKEKRVKTCKGCLYYAACGTAYRTDPCTLFKSKKGDKDAGSE